MKCILDINGKKKLKQITQIQNVLPHSLMSITVSLSTPGSETAQYVLPAKCLTLPNV